MIALLICALAFGAFTFGGTLIAQTYFTGAPLADGPPSGEPPVTALVLAGALMGAVCAYRGLAPEALTLVAASCALMSTIWCVDVRRGIVPDALTLLPLGAILVGGLLTGRWYLAVAALVTAAPFAFMAWRSGGIGMGWGDVKLAALGGALLGMKDALLAFALASLVAIVVAKFRRTAGQPIAFAPYLASAIVVPLCLCTGA